ncbi:MAG TPA: UDP-N-acetylmuramoyl-L-alanine--D-glutamate ligase [Candidatus Dormibacteraeota bacterium]|nr:UDP-N-acetylmuramoyl-L-alanine--D-glutamate ligase [Candidatus Dormibacteraeota bacterium]
MELKDKRVLVVGLERTGLETALFCLARGARVTASERRGEDAVGETARRVREAGASVELGGHLPATFLEQDLIVPSPGVPLGIEPLAAARARGIPVWSEIELASRFLRGRLLAITGSNGKTTTTLLAAHILRQAGRKVLVGGNVGTPLISLVQQSDEDTITVAEVSSFQLEAIADGFRPGVAALLNVTPDHLDRHVSMETYSLAKARIFQNQQPDDAAVVNADDPGAAALMPERPRQFRFSRREAVDAGACLDDGRLVFRSAGHAVGLLHRADILLPGEHNVENVLAAACIAVLAGVAPEAIREAVRGFPGVEHRLEFVARIAGVSYYNDSKATNVDAALKSIAAFRGNLLVILGGKDKGGDFSLLSAPLAERARLVLLIGAAAPKIAGQLGGAAPVESAGTLERAVERAFERARPGDTVLLAPACASFDQFRDYEDRGRVFKGLVRRIENRVAAGG